MCLEFHYHELFITCNLLLLTHTYTGLRDKHGSEKKTKMYHSILSSGCVLQGYQPKLACDPPSLHKRRQLAQQRKSEQGGFNVTTFRRT